MNAPHAASTAKSSRSAERLTAEQERELATLIQRDGSLEARNRLVSANLPLVFMVASKYAHRGVPLDDLIAEGNVGLIRAAEGFNPNAGARFSTYAVYWISHSIIEAFIRQSAGAALSRNERADRNALQRTTNAFVLQHGRDPTTPEIAAELRWGEQRVAAAMGLLHHTKRAQTLSATERSDAEAVTATESPAVDTLHDVSNETLEELLGELTEQERTIISLRYGLNGHVAASIGAIAKLINLPQRVVKMRFETSMRKLLRKASRTSANLDIQEEQIAGA